MECSTYIDQGDPSTEEERSHRPQFLVNLDRANKMLLDRLRQSTRSVVSSPLLRRLAPVLLLLVLIVYLLLGATAFFFFEHSLHESSVRRWNMNLAVNRRHFARSISSRIFNDTRNLLIIIDKDQTERVQQILVDSLKKYEGRLELETPDKQDWNLLNSFNYAYGILLTLGHNSRIPETIGGQVFSLVYCLFGVPLFLGTLFYLVKAVLFPLWKPLLSTPRRRLLSLTLSFLLLLLWCILISLFLYGCANHDVWSSIYVALFSSLTIQVNKYDSLSAPALLVLLLLSTVSLVLTLLFTLLLIDCVSKCSSCKVASSDVPPDDSSTPKFRVVVDESGESHLTH